LNLIVPCSKYVNITSPICVSFQVLKPLEATKIHVIRIAQAFFQPVDEFHDKTIVVTRCGRICLGKKKINFSQVFAGQAVGIKEVHDDIWLVSFMD
jgi:hypothetical protein